MAVLKKIRSRLFSTGAGEGEEAGAEGAIQAARAQSRYDVRPLTAAQLDECWRLDLRCFVDGVYSELGPGAMRRFTARFEAQPKTPLVCRYNL